MHQLTVGQLRETLHNMKDHTPIELVFRLDNSEITVCPMSVEVTPAGCQLHGYVRMQVWDPVGE